MRIKKYRILVTRRGSVQPERDVECDYVRCALFAAIGRHDATLCVFLGIHIGSSALRSAANGSSVDMRDVVTCVCVCVRV